jgi:predicted PurR-regulated permease PerM
MAGENQNKTYFYAFLLVVLALGLIVLWPMRDILLLGWVITTLFRPIFLFFKDRLKAPIWAATLVSVLAVFFTVFIPLTIFVNVSISQFQVFYRDITAFSQGGSGVYEVAVSSFDRINTILARIPYVEYRLSVENMQALIQHNLAPIANFLLSSSVNVGVSFAQSFPLLIVFVYLIWYGFPEYDRFIHFAKRLSPLPEKLDNLYLERITAMVRGIMKGTFTIAFVQASIAALSLWIAGVPYVFFWFLTMLILSVLPLGATLITFPAAAVLFMLGQYWQAVFVLVVQLFFTSTIDNILRPYLVPKEAEIHPVLLLLSFIGGIQVFGAWGFIYGPLIMVVMITSFEVYQNHYKAK